MSIKRSQAQMEDLDGVHASRQTNFSGPKRHPRKKPRLTLSTSAAKNSVNPLKKKIRDVSRLLSRSESLPAGVRVENERALASYKLELAEAMDERRRQKMIKKYHMVRFFERQKATRQLKQLRKQLASSTSSQSDQLQRRIHEVEVDLNYTLYCPLDQKYVSLYKSKDEQDDRAIKAEDRERLGKPPLWREVEDCMAKGTLQELRNGRSNIVEPPTKKASILSEHQKDLAGMQASTLEKTGTKERHTGKKKRSPSPDNASDGGFFEE